jgi:hypothetical protein
MKWPRLLLAVAASIALALLLSRAAPAPASSESAYWWSRALGARPALVSRYQFQYLKPLRSWQDIERLRDYVAWADRPESAGLHGPSLDADVSEYDLILLRIPAFAVQAPVRILRDPLGFAVLDPGRTGRLRIPIAVFATQVRGPLLSPRLPPGPVPSISGAVAASANIVEIYGVGFSGTPLRVVTPRGPAAVLYAGPGQINACVDVADRVAVEVGGILSEWAEVRR